MFYEDFSTRGTLISVGDTYHDVALAIKDALVGIPGSPWAEVTGSAPTPVWLQPYATTAVAGRDSSTAAYNGWDVHATMYMTTDAGHKTKTITVAGSAGTLIIDIDGTDYSQAFNTSAAQTATDWLTTHTATLAALGSPIVATAGGSAEIVLYKAAAEPVLTDDSTGGMSFTWSANCVLFRIVIGYHGVVGTIIDTHQGNPVTTAEWCILGRPSTIWNPDTNSGTYYAAADSPDFLFKYDTNELTCPTSGNFRFYIWMWDEFFAIITTSASNSINGHGGVMVWHPAENGIEGLSRASFPHIWGMMAKHTVYLGNSVPYAESFPRLPYFNDYARAADYRCDISGIETRSIEWIPEFGFLTSGPGVNGNIFVQRVAFHSVITVNENTDYSFYSGPWTEGVRLIDHSSGYTEDPLYGALKKITIGGVSYIQCKCLFDGGGYASKDAVWLLPLSDLTL